jgi:hypothetical protein
VRAYKLVLGLLPLAILVAVLVSGWVPFRHQATSPRVVAAPVASPTRVPDNSLGSPTRAAMPTTLPTRTPAASVAEFLLPDSTPVSTPVSTPTSSTYPAPISTKQVATRAGRTACQVV